MTYFSDTDIREQECHVMLRCIYSQLLLVDNIKFFEINFQFGWCAIFNVFVIMVSIVLVEVAVVCGVDCEHALTFFVFRQMYLILSLSLILG